MPEWKDVLGAAMTLLASFAGAWAAFSLEGKRRQGEKEDREVAAGNRAIYGVYSLWKRTRAVSKGGARTVSKKR